MFNMEYILYIYIICIMHIYYIYITYHAYNMKIYNTYIFLFITRRFRSYIIFSCNKSMKENKTKYSIIRKLHVYTRSYYE